MKSQCIDAVDNGINQYVSNSPPLYVNNTHVSARVGRLNPDWTEESSEEKENIQFHAAMELIGGEFVEVFKETEPLISFSAGSWDLTLLFPTLEQCVKYYAKSWLPARSIVEESLQERKDVHESGEIIKLKSFCPVSWSSKVPTVSVNKLNCNAAGAVEGAFVGARGRTLCWSITEVHALWG